MTEQTNNPPQFNLQQTPPNQRNPLWGWLVGLALIIIAAIVLRVGFGPVNTGTAAANESDRVESEAPAEDNATPQNGFAGRNNALGIPATPTPAATPTAKVYTEAEVQATVEAAKAAAVEQRENELLVPSSAQPEPTPTIRVEKAEVEINSNQATVTSITTSTVSASSTATKVETETIANWQVTWYAGATDQMHGLGSNPWPNFDPLAPSLWPEFPNVDNTAANFPANIGLEFGEDESQFCGTQEDSCSIVIPPQSYVLVTGNARHDLGECWDTGGARIGCAQSFFNVGLSSFELNGEFDNVYIVQGRYWHGDFIPRAASALMSHASNNMTNGVSKLNPEGIQNAGGNCSSIDACLGVLNQFYVTSGAELLIHGVALYRP